MKFLNHCCKFCILLPVSASPSHRMKCGVFQFDVTLYSTQIHCSQSSNMFIEKSWPQNLNWRSPKPSKRLLSRSLLRELLARLYVKMLQYASVSSQKYPAYASSNTMMKFLPIFSTSYGNVVEISPSFAWRLTRQSRCSFTLWTDGC